jgi:hypothetical protein
MRNTAARYHVYNTATQTLDPQRIRYPRADGGPIAGLAPELVLLEVVEAPAPEYEPATQILGAYAATPRIDLAALTATYTRTVLPKPPPTLTERLDALWAQMPTNVQLQFDPLRPLVRIYLEEGRPEMIRALIDAQEVPPELAGAKAQMLTILKDV